jgi:hypothetical protein
VVQGGDDASGFADGDRKGGAGSLSTAVASGRLLLRGKPYLADPLPNMGQRGALWRSKFSEKNSLQLTFVQPTCRAQQRAV